MPGAIVRSRLFRVKRKDVYEPTAKPSEPNQYPLCGAVFTGGRWTWNSASQGAHESVCPACQRTLDHYPAGNVRLKGRFFQEHEEEILHRVKNVEKQEKDEHPMERILSVRKSKGETRVTTAGVHLARRIGQALARAYGGGLSVHYGEGDKSVRILWER